MIMNALNTMPPSMCLYILLDSGNKDILIDSYSHSHSTVFDVYTDSHNFHIV